MSFRNTLLLLVVLLLLGGYYYGVERNQPQRAANEDEGETIWVVKPEEIVRITVRRAGSPEEVVVLERDASARWQIVQPEPLAANEALVSNLIPSLAKLGATRIVEQASGDLALYGLQPPQFEVTLTLAQGEKRLLVGDQNPTKSGYYVQQPDVPAVYLVPMIPVGDLERWLESPPALPTPTPKT